MANTITIGVDLQIQSNNLLQSLQQAQNIMKSMGNESLIGKNAETSLTKMISRTEQFQQKMKEASSVGDWSKLEKEFLGIIKDSEKLQSNINKISNLSGFDILPTKMAKAFAAAQKEIEKALTQIRNFKIDLASLSSQKNEKLLNLESLNKDLEVSKSKIEALTEKYRQATTNANGKQNTGAFNMKMTSKEMKSLVAEQNEIQNQIKLTENEIDKLDTKMQNTITSMNKVQSGEAFQKTRADIEQLDAKIVEGITDMEGLSNSFAKFSGDKIKEANSKISDLNNSMNKATVAINTMASGMQQIAKGSVAIQSTSQDISMLTSRLSHMFSSISVIMKVRQELSSLLETMKKLDSSMADMAVVTENTVSDYWKQLSQYTITANKLGTTIQDVYDAATLYYQQGLSSTEVTAAYTSTLKMARIAGLDAAEATDRMTNALRGFNMEITQENSDHIADVYSKLAASSASNVDEISTAMTKTASIANAANMSFENTAAFISTIVENTRESAETAGTALKTVIARFSEVKNAYTSGQLIASSEDGEEINVNKVSTALRQANINLNEYFTGVKGLDDIFLDLASKWNGLDQVTQRYIATMAAGSRQQSRFIALMQNYSRTQELVTIAQNANGASTEQFNKTLDSLETKLSQLQNAWDSFKLGIVDSGVTKGAIEVTKLFMNLINGINAFLNGLPAGGVFSTIFNIGTITGVIIAARKLINAFIFETKTKLTAMQVAVDHGFSKNFLGLTQNSGKKISAITSAYETKELQKQQALLKMNNAEYAKRNGIVSVGAVFSDGTSKSLNQQVVATKLLNVEGIEETTINKVNTVLRRRKLTDEEKELAIKQLLAKSGMNEAAADNIARQAVAGKLSEETGLLAIKTVLAGMDISEANRAALIEDIKAGILSEEQAIALVRSGQLPVNYAELTIEERRSLYTHQTLTNKIQEKLASLATLILDKLSVTTLGKKTVFQRIYNTLQEKSNALALVGLGIIGAVLGIAYLLYKVISNYGSSLESLTDQQKRYNDAAKQASDNIGDLKEEYSTLTNYFEKTKKQIKIISALTNGTEEWKEATDKLTSSTEELIKKYPEISKYTIYQNGALILTNEDAVKDSIQDQINNAQQVYDANRVSSAQTNVLKANSTLSKIYGDATGQGNDPMSSSAAKTAGYGSLALAGAGGVAGAMGYGSSLGLAGGPMGAVVGAIVGLGIGLTAALFTTSLEDDISDAEKNLSKIEDTSGNQVSYRDTYDKIFKDMKSYNDTDESGLKITGTVNEAILYQLSQYYGDSLGIDFENLNPDDEETQEIIDAISEAQNAINSLKEAEQALKDSINTLGVDIANQAKTQNNTLSDTETNEIAIKSASEISKNAKDLTINESDKKSYAKAMGYAYSNNKFYETDENGNALTSEQITVDNSQIKLYKAQQAYMDNMDNVVEELRNFNIKFGDIAENFAKDINGLGLTKKDLELLEDSDNLSAFQEMYGEETVTTFIDAANNAYNSASNLVNKDFTDEIKTQYETIVSEMNLSAQAAQGLANNLDQIASSGGSASSLLNILSTQLEGLSIENKEKVISALSNTDLTDITKIEDTITALKELGIEIGDSLLDSLIAATGAVRKFDISVAEAAITSADAAAKTVQDKIDNDTTTYSKEELINIIQNLEPEDRANATDNFYRTGADEYVFVEDEMDLLSSINDNVSNILTEMKGTLEEQIAQEQTTEKVFNDDANLQEAFNNKDFKASDNESSIQAWAEKLNIKNASELSPEVLWAQIKALINDSKNLKSNQNLLANFEESTNEYNISKEIQKGDFQAAKTEAGIYSASSTEEKTKAAQSYTKALQANAKQLGYAAKATEKMSDAELEQAIAIGTTQKRTDKTTASIKKYCEALKNYPKDSQEYFKNLGNIAKQVNTWFGSGELVDEQFVADNLSTIEAAANGDEQAVKSLTSAINQLKVDSFKDFSEVVGYTDFIDKLDFSIDGSINIKDSDFLNNLQYDTEKTKEMITLLESLDGSVSFETATKYRGDDGILYDNLAAANDANTLCTEVKVITGVEWNSKGYIPSSSGSSSGGGGGDSKTEYHYAKNENEKLNNYIQKREAYQSKLNILQEKYNNLLHDASATYKDIADNQKEQISNLQKQYSNQKTILSGYQTELNDLLNGGGKKFWHTSNYNEDLETYETIKRWTERLGWGNSWKEYVYYEDGAAQMDWERWEKEFPEYSNSNDPTSDNRERIAEIFQEYKDYMEEVIQNVYDSEQELESIESQIYDLRKSQLDELSSLIDDVVSGMEAFDQDIIDERQAISDSIGELKSSITDSIQEQIDLSRQIRDNTEKEEDIADKEARLAYLRRDTSGANDTEILKLEKELESDRQDYQDTLVDQALERITDANDKAAEQRDKQIEILQAQLDYNKEFGVYAKRTENLIAQMISGNAEADSEITKYLQRAKEFQSKSNTQKTLSNQEIHTEKGSASNGFNAAAAFETTDAYNAKKFTDANGDEWIWIEGQYWQNQNTGVAKKLTNESGDLSYDWKKGISVSGGSTVKASDLYGDYGKTNQLRTESTKESWKNRILQDALIKYGYATKEDFKDEYGDKFGTNTTDILKKWQADVGLTPDGAYGAEDRTRMAQFESLWNKYGDKNTVSRILSAQYAAKAYGSHNGDYQQLWKGDEGWGVAALQTILRHQGFYDGETTGYFDSVTETALINWQNKYNPPADGHYGVSDRKVMSNFYKNYYSSGKKYKTGGLADYTGPAWLDGTPSKPELVLNQTDTQNFIKLKDILAQFMSSSTGSAAAIGEQIFNINIDIESIANDYDVEQLADKLKQEIYNDCMYRNNTTLGFIR